jgi:hypothetical protein
MKKSFKISENFYQEALFTFKSNKCFCAIDEINLSPTEKRNVIKVTSINAENIKFAFQPKDGLVRVSQHTGAVEESNILNSLLSIEEYNIDKYKKFFEKNGFFYPISGDHFEEINDESLMFIVDKLKATVELMSQISEIQRKDYKKLLSLTLYLLLEDNIAVKVANYDFKSCYHKKLMDEINNAKEIKDNTFYLKVDENFDFEVKDTIYGKCKLNLDEYRHLTSDPEVLNDFWRAIIRSYVNRTSIDGDTRLIIEVLYHVFFEIGWFWQVDKNGIIFAIPEENVKWDKFDDKLKQAIIKVAKITVTEEINSHLDGIYPEYDYSIMEPRWRVESLISALYFSIFYMKPNVELTRICANPRCHKYFTVSRTSVKKKYCCPECANRDSQNRYRAKQKGSQV